MDAHLPYTVSALTTVPTPLLPGPGIFGPEAFFQHKQVSRGYNGRGKRRRLDTGQTSLASANLGRD